MYVNLSKEFITKNLLPYLNIEDITIVFDCRIDD